MPTVSSVAGKGLAKRNALYNRNTQETNKTHVDRRRQPPLRRIFGHAKICEPGNGLRVVVKSNSPHQPPVSVRDSHRQPLYLEPSLQLNLYKRRKKNTNTSVKNK